MNINTSKLSNKLNKENIISYIIKLGETNEDLCFPVNWSCDLFIKDIEQYPPASLTDMALNVKYGGDYRIFFHKTRGYPHPLFNKDEKIWAIFGSSNVMMYFEKVFLTLLYKDFISVDDSIIIQIVENMSKMLVIHWDSYLTNIGCCCYNFFVNDPYSYIDVIKRIDRLSNVNSTQSLNINELKDSEMLSSLNIKLVDISLPGKISRNDSRVKLINMFNDHIHNLKNIHNPQHVQNIQNLPKS